MFKRILLCLLLSFSLVVSVFADESVVDKIDDKQIAAEVEQFIEEMSQEYSFDKLRLRSWFANAKVVPSILKSISRPAEATMAWHQYRKIFIQPKRVTDGVAFWREHAATLERAESTFGVSAEVIVGLIGVETFYGGNKGSYDVFNALYTLGFHFPRRSKFFRKELKEFLLLARDQDWSVGSINGSYAGAMGFGQFMPSSYRMYAVDFDDDGKIDLLNNPVDAIGSVANYIKVHGWQTGGKLVYKAEVSGTDYQQMLSKSLKPSVTVADFIKAGVKVRDKIDPQLLAILIELEQKDHQEYWLGLHNFYVLSRYNPRVLYTMAVTELSGLIKEQYRVTTAGSTK